MQRQTQRLVARTSALEAVRARITASRQTRAVTAARQANNEHVSFIDLQSEVREVGKRAQGARGWVGMLRHVAHYAASCGALCCVMWRTMLRHVAHLIMLN